ncbi:16708_t:CDS:1, partial [Gigaspora rosea]
CGSINYKVKKMEDIIPVVKERNKVKPTKLAAKEKMSIDHQTSIEQKKKLEDSMLVDKENSKLDLTELIVEKK